MVTSCALYIGCKDVQLAKIRGTQNESKNHAPSLGLQTFWIRQFADIPEVELLQGFDNICTVKITHEFTRKIVEMSILNISSFQLNR